VLKVDPNKKRISLGMKQLQADPWSLASEKYKTGDRVQGTVTRTTEFGAFVQLEPGLEGLIHLSEMSWSKKIRKPADVVKAGEQVEVVVLGVNPNDKRISLGLKQALGDPWEQVVSKYPVGAVVEAKVSNIAKFGAFVELGEGIEGMIHVGDLSNEKRINHPQEVLKTGETVKAIVLSIDNEKRRIRLGVKQLVPTSLDEYMEEHKEGDVVTGRVADVRGAKSMIVELGEGVQASCVAPSNKEQPAAEQSGPSSSDIGTLTSMLSAKWKQGNVPNAGGKKESVRSGEIRSFRIIKLDKATKRIEVEVV
jgi:small subunit ribosomal protein S1